MKASKTGRYQRVYAQLEELMPKCSNPVSRMASIAALLHHKMDGFFWTGFYLHSNGELEVGPYQGALACMQLKRNTGVCWAAVNRRESIVVPNVHEFEGHIACDSRSNSEITVPVFSPSGEVFAVLDIDSTNFAQFDADDAKELGKIVSLTFR